MPTSIGNFKPMTRSLKINTFKKRTAKRNLRFLLKTIFQVNRPRPENLEKADRALQRIGLEEVVELIAYLGLDPYQENKTYNVLSSEDLWELHAGWKPEEFADYLPEEESLGELNYSELEFCSNEAVDPILLEEED